MLSRTADGYAANLNGWTVWASGDK
jgi:hypothetical protein